MLIQWLTILIRFGVISSHVSFFFFRYSHNFTENWVAGERHVLKVMVVLLSRSVTVQGNLTTERREHLTSCQEASASEGREVFCWKVNE